MEITLDCLPCMLKQALEAGRMVTDQIDLQEKIMTDAMRILLDYKAHRNAPDLARSIHHDIRKKTGIMDPYVDIKERDLTAAMALYPFLKDFVRKQEDALYWALKTAATGNSIDAAIYQNIDVKSCVETELEKEFYTHCVEVLKNKLKTAENILILGDNTGETVFDKVLIEQLKRESKAAIYYAVRNEPILNDTTKIEAIQSGIDEVAEIISSGCNSPGTMIEECSPDFLEIYQQADVIISKGQGNYESLSDREEEIFFLLKAKCSMIAKKLGVRVNDYVLKYHGGR